MRAKLLGLAALLLLLCVSRYVSEPHHDEHTARVAATLFPPSVGPYQRTQTITHDLDAQDFREELADYSLATATTVQIGALVGDKAVHNGIACHLTRGETLISEDVRSVQTRNAAATFDVAFVWDDKALVLIANTACFSDHCGGDKLHDWKASWHDIRLDSPFLQQLPVVPVTLELRRDDVPEAQEASTATILLGDFLDFTKHFDLSPMQELAARQ